MKKTSKRRLSDDVNHLARSVMRSGNQTRARDQLLNMVANAQDDIKRLSFEIQEAKYGMRLAKLAMAKLPKPPPDGTIMLYGMNMRKKRKPAKRRRRS